MTWRWSSRSKPNVKEKGCGIRDTTRLISRLRHRQFGVFVTTSWVGLQAYKELVEDGHPVLVLSGRDILEILKSKKGISTEAGLLDWLSQVVPVNDIRT